MRGRLKERDRQTERRTDRQREGQTNTSKRGRVKQSVEMNIEYKRQDRNKFGWTERA